MGRQQNKVYPTAHKALWITSALKCRGSQIAYDCYIRSMKVTDRQLGLLTILVLLGAGLLVALLMYQKGLKATTRIHVVFDELGSLQPEDPVTSRGYPMGTVGAVKFIHNKAFLELVLDEPIFLREGTIIRNENFSLMGQRRVEIIQSQKGKIVSPDYVFQGEFEPGIAEAMHLISQVRLQVIAVRDLVFVLSFGDKNSQSIPALTEKMLAQSDQVITQLETTVNKAAPKIASGLSQIDKLTAQSVKLVQQTDSVLTEGTLAGEDGIRKSNELLLEVQKALVDINAFLEQFQSQPIVTDLLYKQEMLTKVNALVVTLQDIMKLFDKEGGMMIKDDKGQQRAIMGLRNVHMFGRASDKAKKAAKHAADSAAGR